jgi:hypothetical protein
MAKHCADIVLSVSFNFYLDPALLDDLQLRLERAEEEFWAANLDERIQELKDARISQVRFWDRWRG